jgi:hypothetical protein
MKVTPLLKNRILSVCVIASCTICADTGFAQVAQVNQGHVLDSNPGVGTGGNNQGSNGGNVGYSPINGNALGNGNITGLGYLHINEPYSSPYQLQVNTGSPISRFEAVSAPLVAPQNNAQSIYRPFYIPAQTVTTMGPNGTAAVPTPIGNGFGSSLTVSPYGNYAKNATYSLQAPTNINPLKPSNLDLPYRDYSDVSVPQYQPMVNNLYGLRQQQITPDEALDPNRGLKNPSDTLINGSPAGQNGVNGNQTKTPKDYGDEPGTTVIRTDADVSARVKGGITLQPLDAAVAQPKQDQPQNQLVGQTNSQYQEGTDLYAGLLAQVNKAKEQKLAGPSNTSNQVIPEGQGTWKLTRILDANGNPTDQFEPLVPGTGLPPGGVGALPGQSDTSITGLHTLTRENTQSVDPTKDNYRPPIFSSSENPMQSKVILQAGRKVKPMETLAGKTKTTFNGVMSQAEDAMKQGNYLLAAEVYQGAISLEPENGLAVVGRAHAELAAGLYESSAYDLKFLFHRHPELMAVHYDLPEFMSQKRLDFVTDDLRTLARKNVAAASFLTCYVDYQAARQDTLIQDFADWYSRHPDDQWGPVVEKAWVEQEASQKPATVTPAPN